MKLSSTHLALLVSLLLAPTSLTAYESTPARQSPVSIKPVGTVTMESLLEEMVSRTTAAAWPVHAYICKQASSYDRQETDPTNPKTWHANHDYDQFIRIEEHAGRKEWVMMEDTGPGVITRFWAPLPRDRGNPTVRFYFDGSSTPAIEVNYLDLLGGQGFVKPPLAFIAWNETDLRNQKKPEFKPILGVGGDLYLPIPFAKSCKVTLDKIPFYYLINYRIYEGGTPVDTFSMAGYEAAKTVVDRVSEVLLAYPDRPATGLSKQATLPPGAELTLDLPPGSGAISQVQVQIDPKDAPQVLRSIILQGTFDEESTIWCPVGDFFGAGARLNPVQDWYRTVTSNGTLSARWTMPYRKSGHLGLKNVGTTPVFVKVTAQSGPWTWDENSLLFHANWRCERDIKTRPMQDWNYIEIKGRGVYVGDTLTVFNRVKPVAEVRDGSWYGEGDERIYVDGEKFPSHFGTGTEDYYGYAWGMPGYFSSPFISAPRRDGDCGKSNWDMAALNWAGYTTNSRVRLLDGIPFKNNLKFDMEIWHCGDHKVDYAAATFWYARPGATHNRPPVVEVPE